MPEDSPPVSVIIPMHNERSYIGQCLTALSRQDYPAERLEIIVVDGQSEDGSQEIVERMAHQFGSLRLLTNPDRIAAAGLNLGLDAAQGAVIIILGAHSEVAEDFVSQSVRALETTGADCVGGLLESVAYGPMGEAIAAAMSSPFGIGDARFRYSRREGYVDTVAFGAYRREVFQRIGRFDEHMYRNVDDEFNYRLASTGGKLWLAPSIRSRYYTRDDLVSFFRQYFDYGRWKVQVMLRHPSQVRVRHLVSQALVAGLVAGGLLVLVTRVRRPLGLLAGSYAGFSAVGALLEAGRRGRPQLALLLPIAFGCIHLGYGLGFWWGLAQRLLGGRRRESKRDR